MHALQSNWVWLPAIGPSWCECLGGDLARRNWLGNDEECEFVVNLHVLHCEYRVPLCGLSLWVLCIWLFFELGLHGRAFSRCWGLTCVLISGEDQYLWQSEGKIANHVGSFFFKSNHSSGTSRPKRSSSNFHHAFTHWIIFQMASAWVRCWVYL